MLVDLLFWILMFLLGYVAIYFFADYIVDKLVEFSEVYKVSTIILGLFVLGIDIEESMVSLVAAVDGLPYISLGNLIGNTIIAVPIGLGLPALFLRFTFHPLPSFYSLAVLSAALLVVASILVPSLLWAFGIADLILFLVYVANTVRIRKSYSADSSSFGLLSVQETEVSPEGSSRARSRGSVARRVMAGMVLVVVGAEVLVVSADRIILLTGLQETFVGLVVTAFVTNAEEFWLSVNSIRKGHTELGVSAQIGKIMWNISLIYGICGVIIYQLSPRLVMEVSTLIFLGVVGLLLYNLSKGNLSRAKGASYVAICLAFLAFNFLFAF